MSSRVPFFGWVIIFEVLADIAAKELELSHSWYRYVWALLLYWFGSALWLFAMKHGVWLGRWTILFGVVSTIITLLIAYGWYKESISVVNMIGIVVCVIGLVLLERE